MSLLFIYPERPCSLPVIPVNTAAFQFLDKKFQPILFGPDQVVFEGIRGSEVLEIEYIIYN